jgi:CBS domain-containing protein
MSMSEFDEAYDDEQRIRDSILDAPIRSLQLREPILVSASSSVRDAVQLMNDSHTGCVLVEEDGKLVGIFTERDVLTKVANDPDCRAARVSKVMTPDPETLEPDDGIVYALNKMSVGGYRHIPIVAADGTPVAVLSVRDIVNFLVELFPNHVLNLPPSPKNAITESIDGG